MPKLKDAINSALGIAEPKREAPPAKPTKNPVHEHIAKVLGRHTALPTDLVERFYKCKTKMEVKKLLAAHLCAGTTSGTAS